jgi:hypothetical protein
MVKRGMPVLAFGLIICLATHPADAQPSRSNQWRPQRSIVARTKQIEPIDHHREYPQEVIHQRRDDRNRAAGAALGCTAGAFGCALGRNGKGAAGFATGAVGYSKEAWDAHDDVQEMEAHNARVSNKRANLNSTLGAS